MLLSYFPDLLFVENFQTALIASLLFALLNAFLKPVLVLITLPINILTLGIFTFIINGSLIYLVSWILKPGFEVRGFLNAVLVAILVSLFSLFVNRWLKDE